MALLVKIDRSAKIAEFSGDTFEAKEVIKSFGTARWDGSRKVWKVSGFSLSRGELEAALPEVEIEEQSTEGLTVEANEPVVAKKNSTLVPGLPESFSVSELVQRAQRALRAEFPQEVFIRGVIASIKSRTDGTVFLTLASEEDADQAVSCVLWGRQAQSVLRPLTEKGFRLEANLSVMFSVQVRLNPRRAELSLAIQSVVPEYTIAKLLALRDQTNERLRAEGIFDVNRQRSLPALPRKLGLITSTTGTVIHDFRKALDTSHFGFELLWCHASMQGEAAAREIRAAIATLERAQVDAILIFRGGGSAADLAVFNEYHLAKAVCKCQLPVFSAIGHQEDQSSVQDVSYHTEGVPQGLGRYFAERVLQYRRLLEQYAGAVVQRASALTRLWHERLQVVLKDSARSARQTLTEYQNTTLRSIHTVQREAGKIVQLQQQRTEALGRLFTAHALGITREYERITKEYPQRLAVLVKQVLQYRKERVATLHTLVAASSPEVQMRRGFALVKQVDAERYCTRAQQCREDDAFEVRFFDGTLYMQLQRKDLD